MAVKPLPKFLNGFNKLQYHMKIKENKPHFQGTIATKQNNKLFFFGQTLSKQKLS